MNRAPKVGPLRRLIVDHLSDSWWTPSLLFLRGRSWAFLLGVTGTIGLLLPFTAFRPRSQTILLYVAAGLMLPLILGRGVISAECTLARWVILFQRPIRPIAHFARCVCLAYLTLLALFAAMTLAYGIAGAAAGLTLRDIIAPAAGGMLISTILLSMLVGLSATARRHELELLLLLLFVSYVQGVLARVLPMPGTVENMLEYLLFPVNAVVTLNRWMLGGENLMRPGWYIQLILYPAAWLLLAAWRLRRLEQPHAVEALT